MTDLALDPAASGVRIHTFAEGLFARLAHDLELVCGSLSGSASRATKSAVIEAPLAAIEVVGVLRDGRVDDRALSAGERRDIVEKMRREVFHVRPEALADARVRVEATPEALRLLLPSGAAIAIPLALAARPELRDEGATLCASGSFEVSLSAIGSDVVKGPMNAFRVKDRVVVVYDVVFA